MNSNIIVQDDQVAGDRSSEFTPELKYCNNCNVQLEGKFCHSCGQSSKSMIKFFGEVIRELLDDTLGYDSRFKHSITPLFLFPGRLTLDYVKGKRFHYVLPFKLYLITSVLLVLVIKNTTNPTDLITYDDSDTTNLQQEITQEVIDETNQALTDVNLAISKGFTEKALSPNNIDDNTDKSDLATEEGASVDSRVETALSDADESDNDNTILTISTSESEVDMKWDKELKILKGIDEMDEGIVKDFFLTINPKLKYWMEDQGPLVDSIIETLPYMMFIILPIFAIFLKLFYLFSKRYYTEHLIFLLHNHSFIYIVLMVQLLLEFGGEKLSSAKFESSGYLLSTIDFITAALSFWMVIYVFISMKRFYRQGWGVTVAKTLSLGIIYLMMLSFGFIFALAFGAYQA
ncbi:MAG: DUF3667 domain-containing protein [Kangiellaceae bacterium]|nr:DUF3667 domain-containing protein [Kangiellaceae bacterium]